MRLNGLLKLLTIILLLGAGPLGSVSLFAQSEILRKKFYVGMEMGAARLLFLQNNQEGSRSSNFVLGFYGGYTPTEMLRMGINVNGYLLEPYGNFYDDPQKGISISNVQAQVQLFPLQAVPVFANAQGGWSTYTNHNSDAFNSKGYAGKIGLGYEQAISKRLSLQLLLNYSSGRFRDVNYPSIPVSVINQHYNAFELLVGLTYR